jgi:hypothetical protein
VAARAASLSPWVSSSLSPLRVELDRAPNRALELKFGLSGELAAARRLSPASRRCFIACSRCEPPDPKSTARIRSGYTRLPRSTVDRWTRSTAPVHHARQPCIKPASAPCQPSDLQQKARISPSLGHQSRRRTHAMSAVRSGADGLDLAPARVSMASASRHPSHSQSATWRSISPSAGCPCSFCKKAPVLLLFTTMPFHL